MRLIKKVSPKTYEGKDKKQYHYINRYVELDNGLRIEIMTRKIEDLAKIDAVAVLER